MPLTLTISGRPSQRRKRIQLLQDLALLRPRGVSRDLEDHGVVCCFYGTSALIYYGAARVRDAGGPRFLEASDMLIRSCQDWEVCVPSVLMQKAESLLKSEMYARNYINIPPWPVVMAAYRCSRSTIAFRLSM